MMAGLDKFFTLHLDTIYLKIKVHIDSQSISNRFCSIAYFSIHDFLKNFKKLKINSLAYCLTPHVFFFIYTKFLSRRIFRAP
jgi:hypothetical protein